MKLCCHMILQKADLEFKLLVIYIIMYYFILFFIYIIYIIISIILNSLYW